MNNDKIVIDILESHEFDELTKLYCLVWNLDFEETKERTIWAFKETKALMIVARVNNKIIGSRGGFWWPLKFNELNFDVIQFHNTCVHPDYRRRGIFTKLNLKFIEISKELGYKGIFNVSVDASKLGYEKLGWKYLKGFHRLTHVNKPINCIQHFKSAEKEQVFKTIQSSDDKLWDRIDESLLNQRELFFDSFIQTRITKQFLKWRLSNKRAGYKMISNTKGCIIYKIYFNKGNLKGLIIGEVFLREKKYKNFRNLTNELFKKEQPSLTYTY